MKGIYKPKNPHKYKGDARNIIYRSSWEMRFMRFLDLNKDVLKWSSEEIIIPYSSPIDGRFHRYFPDFWVRKINGQGLIDDILIEIKPKYQTVPPKPRTRLTKKYLSEVQTWGVNQAKWKSAERYASKKGWKFQILTEEELKVLK